MAAATSPTSTNRKRRAVGNQPDWVNGVVEMVARIANKQDRPEIAWRQSAKADRIYSSGVTKHWYIPSTHKIDYSRTVDITVTAGTDPMHSLITLTHELAHWVAGHEAAHSASFWYTAVQLYNELRLPMQFAYLREARYTKEAYYVFNQYVPLSPTVRAYVDGYWANNRRINRKEFAYDRKTFNEGDVAWCMLLGYDLE
jgi:hypothetical protein